MEVVVYADVLFALNFLMDVIILFVALVVTKQSISMFRLSGAAVLLAVYGTVAVIPDMQWFFSMLGRVGVSSVAIRCLGKSQWLKTTVVFWLVSIALGGVVFMLSMQSEFGKTLRAVMINGSLYLDVGIEVLLAGIICVYGLIWGFCKMTVRKFARQRILLPFMLTVGGKSFKVTALLDTGCELTVPATGDAMILVSRSGMKDVRPKEPFQVPIRTAGGETVIQACYPETMTCLHPNYQIVGIPAIGFCESEFTKDGLYTAVLNPDMVREIGGEKNETKKGGIHQIMSKNSCLVQRGTRGILHRRQREFAASAKPGGGNGATSKTGFTPEPAGSAANAD